jgi:hypothetical protein
MNDLIGEPHEQEVFERGVAMLQWGFCETLFSTELSLTFCPQSTWAFHPETPASRSSLRVKRK